MVRFADIAFYYLPYVRLIRERLPGTRFVCLQRDRSETVQSYVKWAAGRNFWQEHDGRKYREDPEWDRCYPKVDADSIEEAVGKYWDGYYEEAAVLHREFPGEFGVWRMEDVLNSERGMREVLEFCGIPHSEQVLPVGVRANSLSPFAAKVTAVKGRIKHVVQRLT